MDLGLTPFAFLRFEESLHHPPHPHATCSALEKPKQTLYIKVCSPASREDTH